MKNKNSPLTLKQQRFVEEYFLDPSSLKQAAIRAGIPPKNASTIASGMLKNPKIQEALKELHDIRKYRLGISEDRVLQELSNIAFSNLKDLLQQDSAGDISFDLNKLTPEQSSAITEISRYRGQHKVKLADKLSALIHIGKHIGMFREQIEHSGKLSLEQLVMDSMKVSEEVKEEEKPIKEETPG